MNRGEVPAPVGVNCGWHRGEAEGELLITACSSRAAVRQLPEYVLNSVFARINSKYNSNKLPSTGGLWLRMGGPAPPVPTAPSGQGHNQRGGL